MYRRISHFSSTYLHKRLDYNPISGELRWKPLSGDDWLTRRFNTRWAGQIAGNRDIYDSYIRVHLDGRFVRGHHIVWKMTFGEDPPILDHRDGDGSNNKLSNLREATVTENQWNHRRSRTNTSGTSGVSWHKGEQRWHARIGDKFKRIHLGSFDTLEEAVEARRQAEVKMWGQFARCSTPEDR